MLYWLCGKLILEIERSKAKVHGYLYTGTVFFDAVTLLPMTCLKIASNFID